MEEVESPRGSQAIMRALSVLRAFTADRPTLTMTEIAKSTIDPVRLKAIRHATGETVGLHTRVFDRRICVTEYASLQSPKVISGVGRSYSLSAGAAGKAILSLLPEEEVERVIALGADPGDDPLPPKQLLIEVRKAREQGYATSSGETILGAFAIAVPMPWNGMGAASAINVVGPADRMKPDTIDRVLDSIARVLGTSTRRDPDQRRS